MSTQTIVLAHGIFRFDQLRLVVRERSGFDIGPRYFNGIGAHLRAHGFDVHEPDVNFAGSLSRRASDLKSRLERIFASGSALPVHIIAHSMGGLDARMVLADHPQIAANVACLTTVGTPHLGTMSADVGVRLAGRLIPALSPVIDLEGFADLTTSACRTFNDRVRDLEVANGVRYRTVSAVQDFAHTTPLLSTTSAQLRLTEGASDGIVPQSSQAWVSQLAASNGQSKPIEQLAFPFPADHLNEVGLWDTGELLPGGLSMSELERRVTAFYLELAQTA